MGCVELKPHHLSKVQTLEFTRDNLHLDGCMSIITGIDVCFDVSIATPALLQLCLLRNHHFLVEV